MGDHPIEGLMKTTMESIKGMIDVNTIVGSPVQTPDGQVIIPISKVSFGFASGGGNYVVDKEGEEEIPFAGGSGAGVSVQPVAFMVVGNSKMKLLPVDQGNNMLNSILDFIPKISNEMKKNDKSKKIMTMIYVKVIMKTKE
ncbi:sporulation protein YtfJ [Gottschalkia acidurici 9a]|uniref:Sporulation protein YtfJ n=1 Tax=Gottschalkia acidurici (strain ATCC 7906 / DSM 604 / BCRC 14475 / CIP 104303 / KCTC 5404 / NCIMB 10678 / 9a) TaxID=1128398 RepID=K0AXA5_GOTA9|nr:GerW family sporulation protein [Gottschalkia acidurici]AFS78423.1 sporulation protein YtfJ [Gottschalkia acidurici 9a]